MKQLKPTQVRLTGYSGNVVPTTGTCRIECKLRDKPHTLEFFIADTRATPILGFDSCRVGDNRKSCTEDESHGGGCCEDSRSTTDNPKGHS